MTDSGLNIIKAKYKVKKEIEAEKHEYIMEEIAAMKDAGITAFARGE